jgi:hypothetical protein
VRLWRRLACVRLWWFLLLWGTNACCRLTVLPARHQSTGNASQSDQAWRHPCAPLSRARLRALASITLKIGKSGIPSGDLTPVVGAHNYMRTHSPQRHDASPVSARLETMRGAAQQTPDATFIPLARRLSLNLPGGRWIYAWPAAVEIQTAYSTRRVPIILVQKILFAALASVSLAALAGSIAQWSLNQRQEPRMSDGRYMRSEGR